MKAVVRINVIVTSEETGSKECAGFEIPYSQIHDLDIYSETIKLHEEINNRIAEIGGF